MAYNNNYNNGYNSGYNNGYNNNYNNNYINNRAPRKRSGAKFGTDKNGNPYVSAWKKNKTGFYTLKASCYAKTKEREGKKVRVWLNLWVQITNHTSMKTENYSGLLDVDGKRLYIKNLNMIATAKGAGGYWGMHIGSRKRRY